MKQIRSNTKIFFKNLELICSVGVHDFEHDKPQRIIVNIQANLKSNLIPENDKIDETINYDLLYSGIKKIVKSRHFNLLETLTHSIFEYLSNFEEIKSVKVCVSKPDIYSDCEEVGFEVSNL